MKQNDVKRRGFTLVEVIVVAVIVLVLSAVAIPLYNGFIKQARQDAVDNLAETAAAAANSYWRKTGIPVPNSPTNGITPNTPPLNLYFSADKHIVTNDATCVKVVDKDHNECSAKPYTDNANAECKCP